MGHSGDGTQWDTTLPTNSEAVSDGALEIRDLRKGVGIRVDKEHVALAASSVGGEHKAGSAVSYHQSGAPTNRPDGVTALTAADNGRLWHSTSDGFLYKWTNPAWAKVTASPGTDGVGLDELKPEAIPAGTIWSFAGSSAPTGWLVCDDAAISRTTYALLFAVIGETYGVGDGSTTFNLPDLRGRMPIGVGTGPGLTARALADAAGTETHQLTESELAAHDHGLLGAGYTTTGDYVATISVTGGSRVTEETGGDTAHENMSPFLALNFIIKTGLTS